MITEGMQAIINKVKGLDGFQFINWWFDDEDDYIKFDVWFDTERNAEKALDMCDCLEITAGSMNSNGDVIAVGYVHRDEIGASDYKEFITTYGDGRWKVA